MGSRRVISRRARGLAARRVCTRDSRRLCGSLNWTNELTPPETTCQAEAHTLTELVVRDTAIDDTHRAGEGG